MHSKITLRYLWAYAFETYNKIHSQSKNLLRNKNLHILDRHHAIDQLQWYFDVQIHLRKSKIPEHIVFHYNCLKNVNKLFTGDEKTQFFLWKLAFVHTYITTSQIVFFLNIGNRK